MMLTLTIDGRQVKVEPGTTVIQAAEKLGIYIPRYCYHPGLTVAGSCRMCLVEIENLPKLEISCYTQAQDGMVVSTKSDKVKQARQSMLEFLLSNHPLDCPVCDQSGECDLQNFYMEHGRYKSSFIENKIKRKKAFPIGPHVMLDQERCILCTRCTRFTREVSRSHELGCFNRGDQSVIDLRPGQTLDNAYSGNVIDICPVGALTEREFRFQCRVWYLQTERSICNGCSRGCNISIHYNTRRHYKSSGRRVMRLKPRYNPHVNQWWMSDQGRFGFGFIDENRIESPYLKNGALEMTGWDEALDRAASAIQIALGQHGPESVGVIASPQLSNEDLFLIRELFVGKLKLENVSFDNPWEEPGAEDDFLLKADRNPNTRGAREMGLEARTKGVLEQVGQGKIPVLYVFWHDFADPAAKQLLEKANTIVFHGPNWNTTAEMADVVLPSSTHAEKDGTFTNFEGRIQAFRQAFLPLEEAKIDTEILTELAERLDQTIEFAGPEEVFVAWQGCRYRDLDEFGVVLPDRAGVEA